MKDLWTVRGQGGPRYSVHLAYLTVRTSTEPHFLFHSGGSCERSVGWGGERLFWGGRCGHEAGECWMSITTRARRDHALGQVTWEHELWKG